MIKLRTLGTLDLRDSTGHELRSILSQPKRLAVLVYLALAHPRGFYRRDTLLGLFWPELDHEHARAALRKAVFVLREALGESVLVNRGDEELGCDGAQLWCDAAAFERALAEGRRAEACELYQGDLLPGFFIDGAREFERWLETERAQLRERAAAAARGLADDAEAHGHDIAALQWSRRATALSPDDEGSVRRLIGLLDRVGDRAGALHVYQEFARQLAKDYEAEPSAETKALIDAVRLRVRRISGELDARHAAPPTPLAPAPTVPVPVRARLHLGAILLSALLAAAGAVWAVRSLRLGQPESVIAVGRIQNFATPDSDHLDRAIPQLLATNLARFPGLRVISGARLYEVIGVLDATGGSPRDSSAAIAHAARLAGANEIMEGELYRRPDSRLRLDLRRVDLSDGSVRGAYTVEGSDPFTLVDRATEQFALAAGLPPPQTGVAAVTTASLDAYRLYDAGLRAYYTRGDRLAAHRLFAAALAQDSNFAMAAYYAAMSVRWIDASYDEYWPRAARLASRATDRERLLILSTWGNAWPGVDRVAAAETLTTRYPSDPDGWLLLGDGLIWMRADFLGALAPLHRVVAMDSISLRVGQGRCAACDALELLVAAYTGSDSFPAVLRTAQAWVDAQPRSARARLALYSTLANLEQYDQARDALHALTRLRGANPYESILPADLAIRAGDFEAADSLLHDMLRIGDAKVRFRARWFLDISLRCQGRLREAWEEATRIRGTPPGVGEPPPINGVAAAIVLLERGRAHAAAALFDTLAAYPSVPTSPMLTARTRAWLLTQVATARGVAGDTAALAAIADSVETLGQRSFSTWTAYNAFYVRGLLERARGNRAKAEALFRKSALTLTGGYSRTNLELGNVLLDLRRPREAVRVLEAARRGIVEGSAFYVTRTELHLRVAQAFEAAGQRDSAIVHYRWVLNAWRRADPEFTARRDSVLARLAALART